MRYINFKGKAHLSQLGMGNMRLPVLSDKTGQPIDYENAKAIIDEAIRSGINYFDTAYIYHGGESERFTGMALAEYPRESYYVADKFNFQANPDYRQQFQQQLDRLQMEYIDFYLLHGIQDNFMDECLVSGCVEWFHEMKEAGKITYLGFSFHGSPDALRKMLTIYPWDFVQIQLNYYDWFYGDAEALYDILEEADIPIIVMEPVHGGMLADLGDDANQLFLKAAPDRSIASWAMRWVMNLKNVSVILSGMSTMEQLHDNIQTFSQQSAITEKENQLIQKVSKMLYDRVAVPCTSCRYCTPDCPAGLDIPMLLAAYNDAKLDGAWRLNRLISLPDEKKPSACIGCESCMQHCPQSLDIKRYMRDLSEMMA